MTLQQFSMQISLSRGALYELTFRSSVRNVIKGIARYGASELAHLALRNQ